MNVVVDHDHRALAGEASSAVAAAPVMELEGIHKRFGATRALDGAGITLFPGEVHALVG